MSALRERDDHMSVLLTPLWHPHFWGNCPDSFTAVCNSLKWEEVSKAKCVCVCVTDAVCSRGRSILGCTCTPHHKHCNRLHCDSYMCGCSWVPTDQVDTLQHRQHRQHVRACDQKLNILCVIIIFYLSVWTYAGSSRCRSSLDSTDRSHRWGYRWRCWCSCSSTHSSSQSGHWDTL